MSFGRSASGPGGLSINTGSANLFGSTTSQPAAAGGLFGAATSQPAASQPQQQPSLFGSTATQTPASQPQAAGGLFGQPAAAATSQPQQQATTGGLFGTPAAATSQPAPAGSLFGGAAAATSQPAQAGGLFGGAATQQQQPQQQQQQQQQQPAAGGLFGGLGGSTGGMFGAKPAAASTAGGGLFGQSQPQAAGLTLGQSTQPQVVPGVRIDLSNIKSTTRFNDLQETLQKEIAQLDDAIQKCIKDKEAVDAFLPSHGEQLSAIPTDVGFVTRKSEGAHAALSGDIRAIHQLRGLVKEDADHARLSFKAIDNLKLPTQYHQAGLWSTSTRGVSSSGGVRPGATGGASGSGAGGPSGTAAADAQSNTDLISFFTQTADEMGEMMKTFERNLGEIEVHLHGVQGSMLEQMQRAAAQSRTVNQGGAEARVAELAAVLRDFEESILKVAGVVGGVKEGVTELQLKDFMGHGS
ncbi:uncharacterized protein C8A04DRAFT_38194 [Dichotomopilus funicola]|uniref:Uncharacterized protein n=1 Tax=Dichotomopilus funicola TaxID=1934379 RepID=A0AAN6V0M0_9PEZI|nr:hypothetical protein C8A04DRAFT_38194 [Dichotomopilus funicola]